MSERIEFNSDLAGTEMIHGIRKAGESGAEETRRKFAAELEKKLTQERERKKQKKPGDEIKLHADKNEPGQENTETPSSENDSPPSHEPLPIKIDLLA